MQIIRELEPDPRGIYCGAIGVAHGRSMRFSVAIRTVSINAAEGIAEYGTGGGIVFESTPEAEFEECLQKARVLADRIPEFALLETLRWSMEEGYHLLESHLARMSASASYFGIRLDPPSVRRSLDELAATLGPEPCKVRLTVSADGRPAVEVSPLPAPGEARVALAAGPIDASDRFLYHKTTRRAVYDAARSGRENVEDVILFNGSREVTETTIANIVVEIDGRMVTPPVSCGLLPGTMRARLLEDGLVTERTVRVEELESADRIWLVNSVRGWRRAVLVRD
jgi:para-aminobenzoate synthetase/4-amino-4-deoxychorismate lyase